MDKKIVVISFDEDGDPPSVDHMTKEDFLEKLNEEYWGSNPEFGDEHTNTYNFSGLIVIEGEIIKPEAITVATRYKLK